MEDTKAKIKTFLSRFYRKRELDDGEDIFALGFVNSLFAMQLVMFVEKEFKVKIDNNEIDIDNFRTIDKIASLVERKIMPA